MPYLLIGTVNLPNGGRAQAVGATILAGEDVHGPTDRRPTAIRAERQRIKRETLKHRHVVNLTVPMGVGKVTK
jgi:hypothetical protein